VAADTDGTDSRKRSSVDDSKSGNIARFFPRLATGGSKQQQHLDAQVDDRLRPVGRDLCNSLDAIDFFLGRFRFKSYPTWPS
jgi:hypothetical protein